MPTENAVQGAATYYYKYSLYDLHILQMVGL